jgi:hypothetical protein
LQKKKSAFYSEPMDVRDAREAGFFHIDNIFIDEYMREIGIYGVGVYCSLCRHCNKEQKAWPSIDLMADELGTTQRSVIRGLKSLELHCIVKVDRLKGSPSIYTLMNKRKWKKRTVTFNKYLQARKNKEAILTGKEIER